MNTSFLILASVSIPGLTLAVLAGLILALGAVAWDRFEKRTARPLTTIGFIGALMGLAFLLLAMPSGNALYCLPGAFFLAACLIFARRVRC